MRPPESGPTPEAGPSTVFAGIDEAGLGPILGPLTIGFSVFRAPVGNANLWKALAPVVARNPRRGSPAFMVADSKDVFKRTEASAERLETTALGFLALLRDGRRPGGDVRELLWRTPAELGPTETALAELPWYAQGQDSPAPLPRHVDRGRLELRVEKLARRMHKAEVELLDAGLVAVPANVLNRSFAETDNKAATQWITTERILRRLWEAHASEDLRLTVDRQGGRFHYGPLLGRAFPEAQVERVTEAPQLAEYTVIERAGPSDPRCPSGPGSKRRRMRITFAEKAERRSFAVALASCLAKYARELAMDQLNAHFAALQPDLKRTAGYTTDGRRWLQDAAAVLERERVERRVLIRER